ncbi:MAG: hypothetical protein K2M94_01845 [Paramuribaculum sp.]|nr:hypothetical protein [Paramuribaculum sp.]
MRHFFRYLALLLCAVCAVSSFGKEKTVYLKNGRIVKGVITEQLPGDSFKIQISNGNIYVYSIDDVDKIVNNNKGYIKSNSFNATDSGERYRGGVQKGYRGFADIGYGVGFGSDVNIDRIELFTSHGYQVCPYFYAGGGVGLVKYIESRVIGFPVFADLRTDILNNWISPFVDVKVGYSLADIEGLYFAPSVGCRMGLSQKVGLHLSVGYELQMADVYKFLNCHVLVYDSDMTANFSPDVHVVKRNLGALTIKVGIDF